MMALQPKPMTDTPASLKNLVEPLPASALMGLIKVEQQQQHQLPTAPVPVYAAQPQNNLVKVVFMALKISLNIQIICLCNVKQNLHPSGGTDDNGAPDPTGAPASSSPAAVGAHPRARQRGGTAATR